MVSEVLQTIKEAEKIVNMLLVENYNIIFWNIIESLQIVSEEVAVQVCSFSYDGGYGGDNRYNRSSGDDVERRDVSGKEKGDISVHI